jgi:hypothetical protein
MKIETNEIIMIPDLTLVKLYKPRYRKEKQTVLDEEKNKGKDPKKDIMSLKTIENKVMYTHQTAEIVAINPTNRAGYEVGDIVIVDYRKLKDFDMFKGISIALVYDIIGKVNQTII